MPLASLAPPLHRLVLRVAHRARLVWWRLIGRDVRGCNAIVLNGAGAVLLVRHSYQAPQQWMLPGGGIERSETAAAAAAREVLEETGCRMADARECGVTLARLAGCRHHVHLVVGTTGDPPRADGREIREARFFPMESLPATISPGARTRLEQWRRWREAQPPAPTRRPRKPGSSRTSTLA